MTADLKDNFRGCLIGQCPGDTMGFPVEGENQDAVSTAISSGDEADTAGRLI
jgi:ADP-ribosylglycohydrolase